MKSPLFLLLSLGLLLMSLVSPVNADELTATEKEQKLKTCLSVCNNEKTCVNNCKKTFGDAPQDAEEEEEEDC